MTRRARGLHIAAPLAVLAIPTAARANGPLGEQGEAISTSAYSVDLFQGPVLATGRMTALGGAYSALSEGADAHPFNPASPAVRVPWSVDWIDYDLTAGITFPSSVSGTDFDNNGTTGFTYRDFIFVSGGANLQIGPWGVGLSVDGQQYELGGASSATQIESLRLSLIRAHLLLARSFVREQLVIGAGVRFATLSASDVGGDGDDEVLSMTGASPELGVLWAPRGIPFRGAANGRLRVKSEVEAGSTLQPDAVGDTRLGALYLPQRLDLPWEIEVSAAVQLGPRPLNMGFADRRAVAPRDIEAERKKSGRPGEIDEPIAKRILRARYAAQPREKVLIAASLLLSGSVANAVGFESFLSQRVDRSGQNVSLTPRLGVEVEPLPSWLSTRAGTYLEPSRYAQTGPRIHGTAGFDLKLFHWTVFGLFPEGTWWRAGGFADVARDYFGWGVSAGVWR